MQRPVVITLTGIRNKVSCVMITSRRLITTTERLNTKPERNPHLTPLSFSRITGRIQINWNTMLNVMMGIMFMKTSLKNKYGIIIKILNIIMAIVLRIISNQILP